MRETLQQQVAINGRHRQTFSPASKIKFSPISRIPDVAIVHRKKERTKRAKNPSTRTQIFHSPSVINDRALRYVILCCCCFLV